MRSHRLSLARGVVLAGGSGVLGAPPRLAAQATLQQAAAQARQQWLAHDLAGLVSGSDTVRLQVPGVTESAALGAAQAARLLGRYVGATRETGFELVTVQRSSPERGYVEGRRRYVVQGTAEEREETVFMGFDLRSGRWRLREVRVVQ
jgi:hypothetical protein